MTASAPEPAASSEDEGLALLRAAEDLIQAVERHPDQVELRRALAARVARGPAPEAAR